MVSKRKIFLVLLVSYLIIGLPILFFHLNLFNLSYELLLIPFVINMILYWLYRIDSRFIILNAILFLWLCPFLLVYNYNDLAESMAIYAYYALLTGVLLQIWESWLKYKIRLELSFLGRVLFRRTTLTLGVIWGIVFGISYVIKLRDLVKVFSLYLCVTLIIIYCLRFLLIKEKIQPEQKPKAYKFI